MSKDASIVEIRIFTIDKCLTCITLINAFRRLAPMFDLDIRIAKVSPRQKTAINIRMFPTVIVFLDGVPKLGWEGFASLEPHAIQDEIVMEALEQAQSLPLLNS